MNFSDGRLFDENEFVEDLSSPNDWNTGTANVGSTTLTIDAVELQDFVRGLSPTKLTPSMDDPTLSVKIRTNEQPST